MIYRILYKVALVTGLVGFAGNLHAQSIGSTVAVTDPLGTSFFQNQYLANPAMAGIDSGLHLNMAYRRQWNDMPEGPETKAFTADAYIGKRIGGGVSVYKDHAGLLDRTRVALTYAYHLPLNNRGDQSLHFGLSAALQTYRLDTKGLNGDPDDPSIGQFNRRDNYFEGDFGMSYTGHQLTVQAALPGMVGFLKDNDEEITGRATFFSAVSYRILTGMQINYIEPKVCYRGVKGGNGIVDVGANVSMFNNMANVFALYHTSKAFTAGVGYSIKHIVTLQAMYQWQSGGFKNYSDGNFEIGLTVDLFRSKLY
ncbi:PorP/SprF family type IX secretion system membrane protein [uncultured Chitinophaga sp.]|uniref:PorP/SprF family type IX secretion system membrane protein n=1 Tax=uncultured Chitinophaga sp. TaxID=339340 RepID=UPI0025DC4330|nr:PorP/SprF family type IX secretion system membrane protein [uncultured Chitinophaga sp.]